MNHKNQLVKNTIIIAIGKLSTQVLSYILLPLYTAKMATGEYGTYDFICTVSRFLCPLITLLMEESMFRFLIDAKTKDDRKKIISQTIIYTLAGTVVFIPLAILVFKMSASYTNEFIAIIIFFVISNLFIGLSNALARGLSKIKLYSLSNFILGIVTLILTIIVLLTSHSAGGLLMANAIANVVTAIAIFAKLGLYKYFGSYDKSLMKEMINYSFPLVPNSISWSIINMSDRIILTKLINSSANGIYAMACRFPNIISVLYGYFYTAWKESAAKIIKEDNKEAYYNSIYLDMKKFVFSVTLCLIAIMPFAFPIFINKNYNAAYVYIPIIMIATYFSNLSSFYGGIFSAYKDTKIMGFTTIVAATINLVIDLAFVKQFEIYAACISTLIADLIVYYYRRYKLKEYIKLKEPKMLGPSIIMAVVCAVYYLKYIPNISGILYWTLSIVAFAISVIYSILLNYNAIMKVMIKLKEKVKHKI